jgi:ribulose-phosphate 3-epimerase
MTSSSGIHNGQVTFLPSILSANLLDLKSDLDRLKSLGLTALHVDVMDGHFVPNLTFGPGLVQQLRAQTAFHLDVHLMITLESPLVDAFIAAGAHHITFHVEATTDPKALIDHIHERGLTAGLSLKPDTPAEALLPYLQDLDQILVMTVEPGFGGQSFMENQVKKIQTLRKMITESARPITLVVDGGINPETIGICARSGTDSFVVGNSFFKGGQCCFADNLTHLKAGLGGVAS